jgi:hypothetical protein
MEENRKTAKLLENVIEGRYVLKEVGFHAGGVAVARLSG